MHCGWNRLLDLHWQRHLEHDPRGRSAGKGTGDRSDKERPLNERGAFLPQLATEPFVTTATSVQFPPAVPCGEVGRVDGIKMGDVGELWGWF